MEKTVKERLIEFIHYLGIGQNKFEKNCEISNGYISNIKANPSSKILTKIFGTYPQLNKDWLLTGEGSMLNTPDGVPTHPSGTQYVFPPTTFDLDNPPSSNMLDDDEYSAYVEFLRTSYLSLQQKYAALEATLAKKEAQIDTLLTLLNELKQKQNS